jgi:MFS family permease
VEGLGAYRDLLRNRPLLRLLIGELISGIGDWLYIVAIFVVIYRESGSAALVGAFGAVRLLPYVLLSVPAGIVADRFDRRLVLLASDLYRAGLMVVMAILVATNGPILLIAAFAILAASGSAFFYPAMGAYLPALAKDERQLGPANSAWATIQNFSFIVGPAIGGLVLAFGSVFLAFVLNAVSFLFIAVILWSLPPSHAGRPAGTVEPGNDDSEVTELPAEAPASVGAAAAANLPPAPANPSPPPADPVPAAGSAAPLDPPERKSSLPIRPLAGLTVVQLMAGFLGGGFQVITVILAIDVLKAGEEANGYLNAAVGIGGLIGGLGAGALVLRRSLGLPLFIGTAITGAGTLALGAATSLPFALVAIGVLAAGALVIDVVATTVFQRLVPDELRGRGTGILMTVSTVTAAAGAFAMPILLTTFGPFASLGTIGVVTVVLTGIGVAMIGSAADRAPTPYEATIARLTTLPLFAGVPRPRLESAVRAAAEVPVSAGTVVVRQGDVADRFYIIVSGMFTVTEQQAPDAEPVMLRELGADQVFGELGLLYRTLRTATVTAKSDGLLLALERDDFLALVGASGPLRGRLLGLYAAGSVTR